MRPHKNVNADYLERILTAVIDFLMLAGVSDADLEVQFGRHLERKRAEIAGSPLLKNKTSDFDSVTAAVLHRWFRDPKLLDANAQPKSLRLYGTYPSVESLARAEGTTSTARGVVKAMRSADLLERMSTGRYRPKSRVATVSNLHPIIVGHVAKSLTRYLRTVEQNTSSESDRPKLIERFASIPDLSKKDLLAFQEFSQSHGTLFLAGVDDWLESRRLRGSARRKKSGIAAGIHVFAYVDEASPKPRATSSRSRRAKPA